LVHAQVVDAFESVKEAVNRSSFSLRRGPSFVNEQRMSVHDRKGRRACRGRATAFFHKHRPGWAAALRAWCSSMLNRLVPISFSVCTALGFAVRCTILLVGTLAMAAAQVPRNRHSDDQGDLKTTAGGSSLIFSRSRLR